MSNTDLKNSKISNDASFEHVESYEMLGVKVHAVQIPGVIKMMRQVIDNGFATRMKYIAVTCMHSLVACHDDPKVADVYAQASLVVPDGMPLIWYGRHKGYPLKHRVYGPELFTEFLKDTTTTYKHYFYGCTEDVVVPLIEKLKNQFQIDVVGYECPPFGELSDVDRQRMVNQINNSGADILWVGLGAPKQEILMHDFSTKLQVPLAVGIGAAFDFVNGNKSTAPKWMQNAGLEWLFRLMSEPRRLWKRYLVKGSQFVFLMLKNK